MRCIQEARAAFSSLAAALHPTEANKRPRVDGAGSASASSRAPLLEPAAVSSKRRNLVRPYPSYPFSSPEIVMFRWLSVLASATIAVLPPPAPLQHPFSPPLQLRRRFHQLGR
jgi:hypothetical protein